MTAITKKDLNLAIQCFLHLDELAWKSKAIKEFGAVAAQSKTIAKTWQTVYNELSSKAVTPLPLPDDLNLKVLSFLNPKDLANVSQTCWTYHFLANDEEIWEEKAKKEFGVETSTKQRALVSDWKSVFKTLCHKRKMESVQHSRDRVQSVASRVHSVAVSVLGGMFAIPITPSIYQE